ncbi:MAG: cyclase family protein [Candidatus Binataceae bacterium]|jgi:kynurenine formamidase
MAKAKNTKPSSAAKSRVKPKPLQTKGRGSAAAKAKAAPAPKLKSKIKAKGPAPKARAAAKPSVRPQRAAVPKRASAPQLPKHADLPTRPGAPAGAAWGVFGDDDQVGTINLMTPGRVIDAAGSIRSGKVFSLNLPINIPDPPLFGRGKHNHIIKQYASYILDDYLDNFYPQASSQWDALSHVKHPKFGGYNGFPDAEITGYGGHKLGIDNLARRGIAGRGVLADIGRYHERIGKQISFTTNESIPFEDLLETLKAQKTAIRAGDALLIRIGWTRAYLAMTPEEKAELATATKCPGIEGSRRVAQWLWDSGIAAVASDAPGLEAIPPPRPADPSESADFLHFHMLSYFGMPIGEMWDLEGLAEDCASDRRYDFFFTSAPLNIPGGVGSPPNALAIK